MTLFGGGGKIFRRPGVHKSDVRNGASGVGLEGGGVMVCVQT